MKLYIIEDDLSVIGITESGEQIPVFENGNFVF